jgi:hypothetical protein
MKSPDCAAVLAFMLCCSAIAGCSKDDEDDGSSAPKTSFFVTSDKSPTGNLGGLSGADERCRSLAEAAGLTGKSWHAYLSIERDDNGLPVHARDRIGTGPWYNSRGALLAADLDALHSRTGDPELFVDEHGEKIPGQWPGSPPDNQHDILTGSTATGEVLAGFTCADWTSDSMDLKAQVGHSDGLGPGANTDPPFNSWNSSHPNRGCNDTAPAGGAGRLYCFGVDE